jgi:hypothetical protein
MGEHKQFAAFLAHVLEHVTIPEDRYDEVHKLIRAKFKGLFSVSATVRDVKKALAPKPVPAIPLHEHKPVTGIASAAVAASE